MIEKNHPPIKFGKTGVLIINLGTPDSTSWLDIRKYLRDNIFNGYSLKQHHFTADGSEIKIDLPTDDLIRVIISKSFSDKPDNSKHLSKAS